VTVSTTPRTNTIILPARIFTGDVLLMGGLRLAGTGQGSNKQRGGDSLNGRTPEAVRDYRVTERGGV
jgi:hypothetical protein